MNFDIYQKEIITSLDNLLVIAGPGSGKTTTLIAKVNYLLNFCGEKDILLISFTNKSVDDIKSRLNNNVFVTTFHKLAIDILKYNNTNYKICNKYLLDYIIDEYFLTLDTKTKNKFLRYLNITYLNKNSKEYISIKNLIKTFIFLFKANNHNFDNLTKLIKEHDDKFIIKIILDILYIYEEEKNSTCTLDFDDLIIKANNILSQKYNYKKFKYIIVDEFQDTSQIRLNLIKTIYDNSNSTITVLGDDAQSIYHFSGCDLDIFLNFQNYFKNCKMLFLKNTYRYGQNLINLSENFINKNNLQIKKNMKSKINAKVNINYIYYFNPIKKFKKLLNTLDNNKTLILLRNKKDIFTYVDNNFIIENGYLIYENLKWNYLTIHSSKGLEKENIIILNCSDSLLGIPNKIEDNNILKYVSNKNEKYPYAEERRIFFVAITRCKKNIYLLIPYQNPSPFIKEIKSTFS